MLLWNNLQKRVFKWNKWRKKLNLQKECSHGTKWKVELSNMKRLFTGNRWKEKNETFQDNFWRKEPCSGGENLPMYYLKEGTLQWRRKPSHIKNDKVNLDNVIVLLYSKSFINMDCNNCEVYLKLRYNFISTCCKLLRHVAWLMIKRYSFVITFKS